MFLPLMGFIKAVGPKDRKFSQLSPEWSVPWSNEVRRDRVGKVRELLLPRILPWVRFPRNRDSDSNTCARDFFFFFKEMKMEQRKKIKTWFQLKSSLHLIPEGAWMYPQFSTWKKKGTRLSWKPLKYQVGNKSTSLVKRSGWALKSTANPMAELFFAYMQKTCTPVLTNTQPDLIPCPIISSLNTVRRKMRTTQLLILFNFP